MTEHKFDKHFEQKIIQSMISDHQFAQQMMDVIELKYFELSYTTRIAEILVEHFKNYETFPTVNLLESILNREEKDDTIKRQCLSFLSDIKKKTDFNDLDYVKDKSLQFFRVQNFYRTLSDEVIPLLDRAQDETGNFLEQISSVVQKAVTKGADKDLGYDYISDESERFKNRSIEKIETPWPVMNVAFGGGLEKKRLVAIIGGTGAGKTQVCVNIAAQGLLDGKSVVFYSCELEAYDIGKRIDACISGFDIDQISSSKDDVIKEIKAKIHKDAKLVIKEYAMKSASVDTIKNHLMQLNVQQGFEPDIIIVDYANLLKSSNHKEKINNIEDIWIALKGLAQEKNALVISPVQSNREGYQEDYIRPEHVADCFAIMCHADVVFTIAVGGEMSSLGYGKAFIGKNRLGPTGGLYCYKLIGAKSRVEILELTDDLEREIEEAKISLETKKQKTMAESLRKVLGKN